MTSPITVKLPSNVIELPGRVFLRGQTLKGRAHIVSEDESFTARDITILAEVKTSSVDRNIFRRTAKIPLYFEKNVEVTPVERAIDFEFPIPLTAPFSFDSGLVRVEWSITLSISTGIVPKIASQEIVVVPHFLKSEAPPPTDEIPVPACKTDSALAARYSSFHLWRYMGFLHRSSNIILDTDAEEYTVGDSLHGTVTFLKGFGSGMLSLYLVFLNRWRSYPNISEEEYLILQNKDNFPSGSSFRFSYSLPLTGYPTFESPETPALESVDVRTWWILRAVVSNPLRLNKVTEKEIFVRSLTF
jgi:hypothetical protein